MTREGQAGSNSTPFRRLGDVVYKRRRAIIVVWILVLLAAIPVISQVGKVTSLQQGSATGNQLESVRADNLISAQFGKTIANSSLLVVVAESNVSSPQSQKLIRDIVDSVSKNATKMGLTQSADVYSRLYSVLSGVDTGVITTEQGANATSLLLLTVPATYLKVWNQTFTKTMSVDVSDSVAYNQTSTILMKANSTAYDAYFSHILTLFNSSWVSSWHTGNQNITVFQRASRAALSAEISFLAFLPPSERPFAGAVAAQMTLSDFITDSPTQSQARLANFAIGYVSKASALSTAFVRSAYSLGPHYSNESLYALAGNIVWDPSRYGVDQGLTTLISSFVSPGKDTTLISLGFDHSSDSSMLSVRRIVQSSLLNQGAGTGTSAKVTGQDAINYDFGNATQDDLSLILPVTIVLLIVATGIFFRSALTPFITLGTIGVAIGISQVFIVLVADYIAKVDFTIPTILLTILIGVGTDYSVFVMARYREERVRGRTVEEAVKTSVTWAGESIFTSGATVIISFLALTVTSVVFLRTMGIVVGLGVLVALSIALTLVPSIIGMVGGRAFWPTSGERFARYSKKVIGKLETKRGYFSRSGSFAVRRAKVLIVLAVLVTIPALYTYSNSTPTYDFLSAAPANLESISASNHLTSAFGGGRLFPTYVVMTFNSPLVAGKTFNQSDLGVVEGVSSYIASNPDVKNVTGPTRPYGTTVLLSSLNTTSPGDRSVLTRAMQSVGRDNRTVLVTVSFGIDPYSSRAIADAKAMRDYLHTSYPASTVDSGLTGLYVGGAAGSILDTKTVFDSQFNTIVPLVAVGVALVLLAVLGSLFLPVFAVFSVLMSIIWTLAATSILFQTFYNYQLLFITPFFLFVTLLGLGMDYNIFILTRVREEATKGGKLESAIIRAMEQTGGIITAAAIILAGSLGALMLSSDLLLKQLGFSFAYSILIDALIVRTYLVPAVMTTMGRWNWFSPIPLLNRSHSMYERERSSGQA